MKELIGKKVQLVFDLPTKDWPIPGYPARAFLRDVTETHVRIEPEYTGPGKSFWYNLKYITSIKEIQ